MLDKDAGSADKRERLSKPESQVTILSADVQQALVQSSSNKDPMEGVKTALYLQKTMSQQRISSYVKYREKLVADNAAIDEEFRK